MIAGVIPEDAAMFLRPGLGKHSLPLHSACFFLSLYVFGLYAHGHVHLCEYDCACATVGLGKLEDNLTGHSSSL